MIYFIQAEGVGHVKIGYTADDDAMLRLAELQTGSPVPLRLLGTMPGDMATEKDLHRAFAAARVHGEWFKPVPELLALTSPTSPVRCGEVEVAEKSVQIRVLTVGRRQFPKSLRDQLPLYNPFNLFDLWESVESGVIDGLRSNEIAERVEMCLDSDIDLWGWTRGEYTPGKLQDRRWYDLLIFTRNGTLHAYRAFLKIAPGCYPEQDSGSIRHAIDLIWQRCRPQWINPATQLFIGV